MKYNIQGYDMQLDKAEASKRPHSHTEGTLVLNHAGFGHDSALGNAIDYQHNSETGVLTLSAGFNAGERTSALWQSAPMSTIQAAQFITLHDTAAKAFTQNYSNRESYSDPDAPLVMDGHAQYKSPQDYVNMVQQATACAQLGMQEIHRSGVFDAEQATDLVKNFFRDAGLDFGYGEHLASKMKDADEDVRERESRKSITFGADNGLSLEVYRKGIRLINIDTESRPTELVQAEFGLEGLGTVLKEAFARPEVQSKVTPEIAARLVASAAALAAVGNIAASEVETAGNKYHQQGSGPKISATGTSLGLEWTARRMQKGADLYAHHGESNFSLISGPKANAGVEAPKSAVQPAKAYVPPATVVHLGGFNRFNF